ncbi:SMI1/KNR4 family protein [Streptomyces sp. NPDC049577]|uniref:SMI1/KNR4 family protein n=1 Tax=Streptomyces sp. NPDC049577 TaxID=3155153 RepID=UPI00342310F0
MRDLIALLVEKRDGESVEEPGLWSPLNLRPPATLSQLADLEGVIGQPLEVGYREFLLVSDGVESFHQEMPILGCRDWPDSPDLVRALSFLEMIQDMGTLEDEGLPPDTKLVPVSVDEYETNGIFMMDTGGALKERFWWVGDGSSILFPGFADVISYAVDPRSFLSK